MTEITFGKVLVKSFSFVPGDRFRALIRAEELVDSLGFARGGQQRDRPIGLMHPEEEYYVSKWRGMNQQDRDTLHGVILFPQGTEGPVEVWTTPDLAPKGEEDKANA